MSDDKRTATVMLPARAVLRDVDKLYYVFEFKQGYGYERVKPERGYRHSTSCYAQLGRMTNRESQQAVRNLGA